MDKQKQGLNVSVKSFLTAIVVILLLMVLTYGLTFLIPGGEYARIADEAGNLVFYPTNAALLISLGLADVSYGKWVKFIWKFQELNLLLTSLLLLAGLARGYR